MTKIRSAALAGALVVSLYPLGAAASTWYVAPAGSDSAAGTLAAPFASWGRAQTAAAPGDTVYFRGGRYKITTATNTCGGSTTATVDAIVLSKSGTAGNLINYWAYPGETPVFDFSGITDTSKYNCRHSSVRVEGDYLYLKGLELTGTLQLNEDNHESWCVYITGGSNNKFELMNAHHNMGPGFFLTSGGNNTFLNCDSHENEDTLTSNGDGQSADGFGCHPKNAGDSGNIYQGCRAWWNSDDAWDFINASAACTVENSWAWYQGYKPDALSGGAPVTLAAGNGNGFKGGGYGDPQADVPAKPPQHVIRFNVSFYNKASGYYANHEIVSPYFYNNTAFNNGTGFDMLGLDGTTVTSVGILRNNLAFTNDGRALTSELNQGGPIDDKFNSWDASLGVTLAASDFQSVAFAPPASCPAAYAPGGTVCVLPNDTTSFAGMASGRQADGSLPVLPFLRLSANSRAIDKGTDIGFPYLGKAPDLGAFEYGATGGSSGSGGATGTGGALGTGGATASGSASGSGGATAAGTGGALGGEGGSSGTGGAFGSGGQIGSGTGGMASGTGGSSPAGTGGASTGHGETDTTSGCACESAGGAAGAPAVAVFSPLAFAIWRLRSRRRRSRP